jgi:putative acetyltransferase
VLGFRNRLHPHLQVRVEPRTEMGRIYSAAQPASIGDFAGLHLLADRPARACTNRGLSANGIIEIRPEDPRQPDVQALLDQSDSHFRALYPAESNHLVSADVLGTDRAVFLAARRNGELLGSIALLAIAPGHAEMKRMFVRADVRGIGLRRRLLNALEEVACHQNIARISLETGIKQSEAIGLYRAFGYQDCSPFGDYKDDPLSLFMTKSLRPLTKIDSEF